MIWLINKINVVQQEYVPNCRQQQPCAIGLQRPEQDDRRHGQEGRARDQKTLIIVPLRLPQPHRQNQKRTHLNQTQVRITGKDVFFQLKDTVFGEGNDHL